MEEIQLKKINAAAYFFLASDESRNVRYLSQFSVIARYASGETLSEESLAALPMKGVTRWEDLLKSFIELFEEKNLPRDKVISVCTDGAPYMAGKYKICSVSS